MLDKAGKFCSFKQCKAVLVCGGQCVVEVWDSVGLWLGGRYWQFRAVFGRVRQC